MNAPCAIRIPITFFWECSTLHFSRAPHKCTHHGPSSPQLMWEPGGIHLISQKDQPEGELCSPGTHCWLKWDWATLHNQSHWMVPQKDTVTEREANNTNGLCAQLLPNDDHLQVPGAPFERNLQCLGSDALIYPGTASASASVLSVPGNSGSSSPRSHYHHPSVELVVFSPLPSAAWEVLLTMPVVHTPTSCCPL